MVAAAVERDAPARVKVGGRIFWSVGDRVIAFIEGNCRLTKGRWRGRPFLLELWQKREIYKIFEVEQRPDGRWLRRYRWAYLEVPKKNGKCATFDTLFTLADGRRLRADALSVGDMLLAYDEATDALVAAPVTAMEIQAPEPVYEVVTARGRVVRTTGQHPYLVRGCQLPPSQCANTNHRRCACVSPSAPRWVMADALRPGDRVAVALSWASGDRLPEEDAWLLGAFCGDGGGDGRYTSADPEIIERIERRYPMSRLTEAKGQGYYARGVRPFLREHGLYGCTAYTKRVPDAVMAGGERAYAGFLAGLLDTDGTVSLKHTALEWYSVSRQILADCQHMLAGLGINASLETKSGRYNGAVHHSYRLIVRGRRQVQRLAALLPVTHREKRARLDHWAEQADGVGQRDTATFDTDRVVSVTKLAAQPTMGVEVAGVHTHVTAGLITHNTELIAAIDLYLLLADKEESPEIACGSNSDEQADLVFGAAKAMCELSPSLRPLVNLFAKEIVRKDNPAAVLMRVSAKAKTKDGLNLSGVTLDELHEFDEGGENLFNVLTNGTAAREEPLVLMITTAGFDEETLCGRYHAHALKVIGGEIDDHAFYASIYAADDPDVNIMDDVALDAALARANPSYGVTTFLPFYKDARRKGASNFKRYFLDIWTAAESQWLPEGAWQACQVETITFAAGEPVFCGVDASTKHDSAALLATQWAGDVLRAKARIWERPLDPHTGKPLDNWQVPGGEIAQAIRDLHTAHPGSVFAYDPAFVTWMAGDLMAEGVMMLDTPQTNVRMCPPTKALYELIVERRLQHEDDPALARHIAAAIEITTQDGKQRLAKNRGKKRLMIDGAIALVMAVGEAAKPATEDGVMPNIRVWGDDEAA